MKIYTPSLQSTTVNTYVKTVCTVCLCVSSPAPDFSARVGPHEYQMGAGGVWGLVLASHDQIDTSIIYVVYNVDSMSLSR